MRVRGTLEVIFQPDNLASKWREMFHIHPHAAPVFQDFSLDSFPCCASDHVQPSLLSRPPDIGRLAAQGCFIKVSLLHASIISCKFLSTVLESCTYDESIPERIEKWAAPTFLLVIRNIRSS